MRLKSFYGPTMTEAMRQVREALGEDAIIVATREDEAGGVRVTAAIDEPLTPSATFTNATALKEDTGLSAIDLIAKTLIAHAAPASLAEKLLATATQYAHEDPQISLGAALEVHLKYAPLPEIGAKSAPLMFVGPPGAGKTLCTAKMATAATLAHRKIALISTDTQRAGGMAELAAFARLLKTDLLEIEDPHALEGAVSIQPPETLALIDTAGCNPFEAEERKMLEAQISAAKARTILVLPADMQAYQASDLAKAFTEAGASSLVITRLDMTRRLGDMLHFAYESRLPLAAYNASAKATAASEPLNPVSLARLLLARPKA